jgi:hypothetical protein
MAINLSEITTTITLEIDEKVISIGDYKKASDSFLDLIREVSKRVAGEKTNDSDWEVKVYSGSIGVGVLASPENSYSELTRDAIISGLKALAKGTRPAEYSDKAILCAKSLASLFKKSGAVSPNVRIWADAKESFHVQREIVKSADDLLAASYEEDGAVDGTLEKLDGHGKLQFVIYDLIDQRSIKCEMTNPKLVDLALQNWLHRVEVIGKVQYRSDGLPVSIKVDRIVTFPDKSEIPSLAQMRNLLAGREAA